MPSNRQRLPFDSTNLTLLLSATRRLYLLRTFVSLLNLNLSVCRFHFITIPFVLLNKY